MTNISGTIVRKKHTGEPGPRGQFGTHEHGAPETSLHPAILIDRSWPDAPRFVTDEDLRADSDHQARGQSRCEACGLPITADGERHGVDITERAAAIPEIHAIHDTLGELTDAERNDMGIIHRELNDGAWGEIRDAVWGDFRRIEQREAYDAAQAGKDSSDTGAVNPARAAAEAVYDDEFYRTRYDALDDNQYAAMNAAHDAAVAVAYRNYIGNPEYPHVTQKAYEHLTRPWTMVREEVEPAEAPASWAKRQLKAETYRALSDETLERVMRFEEELSADDPELN